MFTVYVMDTVHSVEMRYHLFVAAELNRQRYRQIFYNKSNQIYMDRIEIC